MKHAHVLGLGLLAVLWNSCGEESSTRPVYDPADEAARNMAFVLFENSLFDMLGVHEDGSFFCVEHGSEINNLVVFSSAGSPGFSVIPFTDNLPFNAYVNNNLLLYRNYNGEAVDLALLRPGGQVELVRGILYQGSQTGEYAEAAKEGLQRGTDDLGDALWWSGYAISMAGCLAEIAGEEAAGGVVAPAATLACDADLTNALLDFETGDEAAILDSSPALIAFAENAGCSSSDVEECALHLESRAAAVHASAEEDWDSRTDALRLAEGALAYS